MQDFIFYFQIGWDHIIAWDALDHLMFIAALSAIYLLKDWKQVLILVTAFTIGHSLTLALSVFNIFRFSNKWVEFLIPCTIVITAVTNLFQKNFTKKSVRINYFLALSFGLIHGMGFANALRIMLAKDQSFGWDLFGFNLGLEAGQIVVVVTLLSVASLVLGLTKLRRREWVVLLSVVVFCFSLQMALERIPK